MVVVGAAHAVVVVDVAGGASVSHFAKALLSSQAAADDRIRRKRFAGVR